MIVHGRNRFRCLHHIGVLVWMAYDCPSFAAGTNSVGELRDIHDPVRIVTWADWMRRGALALGLGILLAVAWWYWQRRKVESQPERQIPPDERARQRLTEALALVDQPERFCTLVSEITRTYLEERFGLRAPERTTEEFVQELTRSAALDSRHKQLLADFLSSCDLVKFAKFEPDRTELLGLHASASRLIEETAPMRPPPPTQGSSPAILTPSDSVSPGRGASPPKNHPEQ
jgi:hypothetical protein